MSSSRVALETIIKLVVLSTAIAGATCVVGYTYLVKIAGHPAAGFFTFKVAIVLLIASFALCLIFSLREFFNG
jgi:hypothetical protein